MAFPKDFEIEIPLLKVLKEAGRPLTPERLFLVFVSISQRSQQRTWQFFGLQGKNASGIIWSDGLGNVLWTEAR